MEKTKPENPGLKGGLKLGFGFEKRLGFPGLVKPGLQTLANAHFLSFEKASFSSFESKNSNF